ncbi:Serine/threonine-protein phosphatase 2A activator 2 [Coelomomyces lativittatus]|nr:Serine/threonine-protein phosphatase 2A activator 2 [Coelomomyces lativittatus]
MAETTTFSEEPPPFSSTPLEKTTPHTSFTLPSRKIISKEDLTLFLESETCRSFREFIQHLSFSIKGFKLSHPVHLSEVSTSLLDLLESIDQVVTSTPPEINPNSRFGNPAFRLFYDRVQRKVLTHSRHVLVDKYAHRDILVKFNTETWSTTHLEPRDLENALLQNEVLESQLVDELAELESQISEVAKDIEHSYDWNSSIPVQPLQKE